MFSRYDPGMKYGSHIDDAIMHGRSGEPLRTDFSLTVFLSPAESCDGGDLVVKLPAGEQEIKLDAGEAVAYSANFIHHVNPVTRGARLAAVKAKDSGDCTSRC
jgi:PKHD-type hydroxylase